MASTAVRTWGTAVIRMTAMDSESARIRGRTAGPGSPGMRTSSSATSTRRVRMMSRALAPSAASRTSKSSLRMKRKESRTPGSSSMTSTTGRGGYVRGRGVLADPASSLSLGFGYREDDILVSASAALDVDGNDLARFHRGDDLLEGHDVANGSAVDLEDRVTRPDPSLFSRATWRHLADDDASLGGQLVPLSRFRRQRLDGEAERLLGRRRSDDLLTWLLANLDGQRCWSLVADDGEWRRTTRLHRRHALLKLNHVLDRRAVELHDDVASLQPAGFGRALLHHVGDEHTAVRLHPKPIG